MTGKVFEKFQGIIDKKKNEKEEELNEIKSLKKELNSFTEIKQKIKTSEEIMGALFSVNKIKDFVARFDDIVNEYEKGGDVNEQVVLKKFANVVQKEIDSAYATEEKIDQEYEEWKKTLKSQASHSKDVQNKLPDYTCPKFTPQQELLEQSYSIVTDFKKVAWGGAMLAVGVTATIATGPLIAGAGK